MWKTGLLYLTIGMVSISGCYYVTERDGEGAAPNVENGTEQSDSDIRITEGTKPAEKTGSNYEYEILTRDSVVIKKYLGDETIVFVPERLDGKLVSTIGEGAFQENDSIEQVVLPQGIEVIDCQRE